MNHYSWFATTWQGGHVGSQNKRIFPRRIYMKIEFSSQRREMLLFLTTNLAPVTSRANQQPWELIILLKIINWALFLHYFCMFLFISHYFKKSVHGPCPWQGRVHGPGPRKWSMDPWSMFYPHAIYTVCMLAHCKQDLSLWLFRFDGLAKVLSILPLVQLQRYLTFLVISFETLRW